VEAQDGQFIFEVQVYLDELIPTLLSTKEFDVVLTISPVNPGAPAPET